MGEEKGRGGGGFVHFSLSNAVLLLSVGMYSIGELVYSMLKLFDLDPRDPFV